MAVTPTRSTKPTTDPSLAIELTAEQKDHLARQPGNILTYCGQEGDEVAWKLDLFLNADNVQITDPATGNAQPWPFGDRWLREMVEIRSPAGPATCVMALQRAADGQELRATEGKADELAIEESLRRVRARFEFPVEPAADRLPTPAPTVEDAPRVKRPPARLGVSLAGLIAADIITPPFNLHRTYKGVELTARVESDGTVTFQGESFKSLSTAGGVARLSAGWRSTPTRKIPQTNGWSFWQFTDADGQEKPIDALRQRFLAERESAES